MLRFRPTSSQPLCVFFCVRRKNEESITSTKSRTDWKRIDVLKDEDIDLSDVPEISPEMFAHAIVRRGLKPVSRKAKLMLHVDSDVLD